MTPIPPMTARELPLLRWLNETLKPDLFITERAVFGTYLRRYENTDNELRLEPHETATGRAELYIGE